MATNFQTVISTPSGAYAEGLSFFRGTGMVNDTLKRLAADLDNAGISYAVIGAIALNIHGYRRFTEDIDLLITREGLEKFQSSLVGLGYRPAFEGATKKFRATAENVPVEIITAGEFPGDGKPKAVAFPEPAEFSVDIDGIKTISLSKLVELKLASGITAPDRLKDLADVQELIKIRHLDEDFGQTLDDSVRSKFNELRVAVENARDEDN